MKNELEDIIKKANPSINDLVFGCKVKGNEEHPVLYYVGKNKGQHCLLIPGSQELLFVDTLGVEILLRDITLEDVLVAIRKTERVFAVETTSGRFIEFTGGTKWEFCEHYKWIPNTPLHLQEQATKDFLLNLMK